MNTNEVQKKINLDPFSDDIDLSELWTILWQGRKLIIILTSFFAIISVIYALYIPNIYRSESILVARDSQEIGGSLSQYAGLASMAGVSLPSSKGNEVTEIIEIIKSRDFIRHLLQLKDIKPLIMAAERYNSSSKGISFNPKIYDVETNTWTRKATEYQLSEPSHLEVHKMYIDNMLSINYDKVSGIIAINIEHISPVFAKNFLDLIILEANSRKRERDINSSSEALTYLQTELSKTSLAEIKESIHQIMQSQLETQMMARINEEYGLIIIEPPFVPEEKSSPNRALICILITLLGGLISLIIVLFRHYRYDA